MTPSPLSTLLVEDESLCRSDFRQAIRAFPEIHLLAEVANLGAALDFLRCHDVDLVFLDISLGRENGLDLLERLPSPPLAIALTAHPQHAVRGFALNLVDYVLKPAEESRLRIALAKVRQRKLANPFSTDKSSFFVEINGKKTILAAQDILGAEAMGNYVLFQTNRGRAISRSTFREARVKLPAPFFLQIGRGHLIARHLILSWERGAAGSLRLHLTSGTTVRASRKHATRVLAILLGK